MNAQRWSAGFVCLVLALPVVAVTERKEAPDSRILELNRPRARSVTVTADSPSKAGVVLEFGESAS